MGDESTVNQYCGQDPNFDVVHDEVIKTRHFPGCGLISDQCTALPCCSDAIKYNFNAATCNDTVLEGIVLFDPAI